MAKLFEAYKLKNLTLKNRIMMSPMCMYSSDHTGFVKAWHRVHYETRAVGGVGLIVLEATAVEARGRISEKDLGIWSDDHIEGLSQIVEACHGHGAKIGVQLAHAGRKSDTFGEPIVAPSALSYSDEYRMPQELTKSEIENIVKAFGHAARRAHLAGFDIIEIHGAHGYLINEFLSPLTNKRVDEYGGSIDSRVLFLKEVLESVTKYWPAEKPIILRVSAEDYDINGNHPEDLAKMIALVKDFGVDIINVSSGGVVNVIPKIFPGYQIKMAEIISKEANIPVIAGGLITRAEMAEEVLQNNRADLVFFGRELLRNPYFPLEASKILRHEIDWPVQYERSNRR